MKFPSREFDEAVDGLCDGSATDSDLAALNELLQNNSEALDEYLWRLEIHGSLASTSLEPRRLSGTDKKLNVVEIASRAPSFRLIPKVLYLATSAAIVLIVVGGFWFLRDRSGSEVLATDPFLAIVIAQSADAEWSGRETHRGVGHAIGRDREFLKKGEATLLLDNSVELKLRGPTEFTFLSVDHGLLHRGQVSARVPESAIGFRLDAPGLNVVDLGTEFSLATDVSGAPAVHVFNGKVRAALPTLPSSRTELTTGETARFDVSRGLVSRSNELLEYFPRLDGDV